MNPKSYPYKKYLALLFWCVTISTLLLWLTPRMVQYVDSNKVGVKWERFGGGTVHGEAYEPGFHLIAPWDKLEAYRVSPQQATLETISLTAEAIPAKLTVAIDYQLIKNHLSFLHQQVGPDYEAKWLLPDIESRVRNHLTRLEADQLCTESAQRKFAKAAFDEINQATQQRSITDFISIDALRIERLELICKPTQSAD
jgi:regulator of protease activity HflC (stomatin/prohibitin superfamily)